MATKTASAVGLDVGTAHVRCVMCLVDDGCLRFLGAASMPSQGWNRSRIADPEAVAECVRLVVKETEARAQAPVVSLVAGIGGVGIVGTNNHGRYEFSRPREVETDDLAFAIERATRVRLEDDRLLLQVLPQDFTLDGRAGYRNPRGAQCSRLEANVHLILAPVQDHHCLVTAIQKSNVFVEETVFEPIAAAYAALLPEVRNRAAAVVDIGMSSTGIALYDGDALALATSLPVSADHFTRDIHIGLREHYGLKLTHEQAEQLKREFGCAMAGLHPENVSIEVPAPDGCPPQEITRRRLTGILEARAEELLLHVKQKIAEARMQSPISEGEGVFLTGGGARLYGMWEKAEEVLECPARHGFAVGIEDWPQAFHDPAWTTVAGLAMYSARLKLKKDTPRGAPSFLGLMLR